MRPFACVLILLLAGCWGDGERAPWNRPNSLLGQSRSHPAWLDDAIKDAHGDNMRMQGDMSSSGGPTSQRSPSSSSGD